MCQWLCVTNRHESHCATNTDELMDALNCWTECLISISGQPMQEHQCLCDLDIEATAIRNGYRVDRNEFGDVELVKL